MLYEIKELLKRPELYQETSIPFWDDEYISTQMFKALHAYASPFLLVLNS